jgi:SAM-dependent methyltransferase
MTAERFWEEHYTRQERVWSGRPNHLLVSEITGLAPGAALDLGCGEGGDAVWLATQGWRVVAVDISATALLRGAMHAEGAGVADRIEWQAHDLAGWRPDREFDLVSAQFLHSPISFPREAVLSTAASAVRIGGTLLIVGHADAPPWAAHHRPTVHLPTSADVYESLALAGDDWQIERCEESPRAATGPDGQTATLLDQVLRLRRVQRHR